MVKRKNINQDILNIAKSYRDLLRKKGIEIDEMILFGSYAKGNYRDDSDIDLCVVSDKFGRDELKELQMLLYYTHSIDERIEPVAISRKDYLGINSTLSSEIKKYGIKLT